MLVNGSSGSGKTEFIMRLLRNVKGMITPSPISVIYGYGAYNKNVAEIDKMGFTTVAGLPCEEIIKNSPKPLLLVLDDLMLTANEEELNNIFTKDSHHSNFSVIFVTQNLFEKKLRIVRNNSHYLVLLRSPNASLQTRTLGMHLFPGRVKFFLDALQKSIKERFGYMLIDLHPSSNSKFALRTSIFPDEETVVFLPV